MVAIVVVFVRSHVRMFFDDVNHRVVRAAVPSATELALVLAYHYRLQ